MSEEEKKRLCDYVMLLIEIDQRLTKRKEVAKGA
jgi:hypothetical protein